MLTLPLPGRHWRDCCWAAVVSWALFMPPLESLKGFTKPCQLQSYFANRFAGPKAISTS
jgi:hypothetical protein